MRLLVAMDAYEIGAQFVGPELKLHQCGLPKKHRRANVVALERELAQVRREIEHVVDAVGKGWADEELRTRMDGLQARKQALVSTLATAGDRPPLFGPKMSAVFAEKVHGLRAALTQTRIDPTEAQVSLRQLVDEIRLTPRDGVLAIDVKGNLAAMLTAAVPADWDSYAALVAGACNQRYLQLWSAAA